MNGAAFPLTLARPGERVRVRETGSHRLAEMGLSEDAHAEVLSGGRTGGVVLRLRSGRLALGEGAAAEVWVERA